MVKITTEIDGKKYELVKSKGGCKQCDLRESCPDPYWNDTFLCLKLRGIWKEVRDADND
jgi:hypothetical protein